MKNKKLIFFIAIILTMVSCTEDFLDKVPQTTMSNELALDNYKNIQLSLNGAYSTLYSANYYGRAFIVIPEIRGTDAKSSVQLSSGRFQGNFNWAETPSTTFPLWNTGYYIISAVNNVLEALEGFEEVGVTEDMINQVRGEALFLRALVHWDLVRAFGQPYTYAVNQTGAAALGVPYIFKTEVGEPERNTVEEVYTYAIDDLKTAESIIGEPNRGNVQTAFASKETVQALLAKIYLYMGDWQNAADYATDVINSGKYSLLNADNYVGSFSREEASSESIFLVYGASDGSYWPGFNEIGYILSPEGYGDVAASNGLLDLFEDGDVRRDLFLTTAALSSEEWSSKYTGKPSPININNINVLRLSEMYLIRAEAQFSGATVPGTNALTDFNAIRTNRGLEAAASVNLADILDERRRELNFEGNGFWDDSRRGNGVERDARDVHGTAPAEIDFPDNRFAFPIPVSEMDANPNMVQNPGYQQ